MKVLPRWLNITGWEILSAPDMENYCCLKSSLTWGIFLVLNTGSVKESSNEYALTFELLEY